MRHFHLASLSTIFLFATSAMAQDQKAPQCVAVHGRLLAQTKSGSWENITAPGSLPLDRLVIALFGAEFKSGNGAVEGQLFSDVGQRGPFPVLESACRFHAAGKADLDFTVERGIAVLTNKKDAPAKVHLHVRGDAFDLTIEPKSRVGIEVYGRLLPGMPHVADPKKDHPVATTVIVALQGEVIIGTAKDRVRLNSPPGPAMFLWDNISETWEVTRFESLPDSMKPMTAKEKQAFEAICKRAKEWPADTAKLGAALEKAAVSPDATERQAAVVGLGAVDDLTRLIHIMGNKEHADTREMAVLALRHWLGRESGQAVKLYDHLMKAEKYNAVQAKNLCYLLAGIEEEKRRQPQTYDLLILALNASKTTTRELAHWHLIRLVPHGKSIAYNAAGPEAQRLEAIAAWRRLVPEGELPLPPKKKS